MTVHHYTSRARFETTPEALWEESIRVEHLDALTPPWLRFEPRSGIPPMLEAGVHIDYRLTWRHLPLRWTTEVLESDYPRSFVYRQARGPYRHFVHRHDFAPDAAIAGRAINAETIELVLFGGGLARRLLWPLVRRDLDRLYDFRYATLARRLGVGWEPLP